MSELQNITAAILAGGAGIRLRSVVPDKPKVLAEIRGRPFIEFLLDQLISADVRSVVLCSGYLGDQLQDRLGTAYQGLQLRYSREPEPLGTGGALRRALPILESNPVLVLNGDSYCDAPLADFVAWHSAREARGTILLAKTDDVTRYGRVELDADGRLRRFCEKDATLGPGWVNAGMYLLTHNVIESISAGRAVSLEREVFPGWIGRGLYGFRAEGRLWDVGVPDAYALANAKFNPAVPDEGA